MLGRRGGFVRIGGLGLVYRCCYLSGGIDMVSDLLG